MEENILNWFNSELETLTIKKSQISHLDKDFASKNNYLTYEYAYENLSYLFNSLKNSEINFSNNQFHNLKTNLSFLSHQNSPITLNFFGSFSWFGFSMFENDAIDYHLDKEFNELTFKYAFINYTHYRDLVWNKKFNLYEDEIILLYFDKFTQTAYFFSLKFSDLINNVLSNELNEILIKYDCLTQIKFDATLFSMLNDTNNTIYAYQKQTLTYGKNIRWSTITLKNHHYYWNINVLNKDKMKDTKYFNDYAILCNMPFNQTQINTNYEKYTIKKPKITYSLDLSLNLTNLTHYTTLNNLNFIQTLKDKIDLIKCANQYIDFVDTYYLKELIKLDKDKFSSNFYATFKQFSSFYNNEKLN